MSKAPSWALEGASDLQAHRINRDWPAYQRSFRRRVCRLEADHAEHKAAVVSLDERIENIARRLL